MSKETTEMQKNPTSDAKSPWDEPIAIVGMSAIFPKATNLHEYWSNILGKVDCITEVPASHWSIDDYYSADPKAPDKTYCKRGGFLPDIPFDPAEFGIPPQVVKATDTSQLLGLFAAKTALGDAGYKDGKEFDRDATSCILGVGGGQELSRTLDNRIRTPVWRKVMLQNGISAADADRLCEQIADQFPSWEENSFPGLLGNVVAGRIANRLNLGGTNLTVDAACASGLAAAHTAVAELKSGLSKMALTGAVDADNDVFMFMCFSKTPAFSASNEARPFDIKGDGILIAEGVGICVLKLLSDAERDGDRIYAVIRGIGSSSDGRYKSIYAPNPDGQAKALRRAYQLAGFGAETVELLEAHGTGTKAGDLAEFGGLSRVLREADKDRRWCALGSVKSQIGHAKATAGIAGLIKTAMAVHEKVLPPTIKVTEPNPKMELDKSPFYLNTEARPWFRPTGSHPRRAGVSAFGFGGTNFHCVLEEYVPKDGKEAPLSVPAPTALFVFTGNTAADALKMADGVLAKVNADERTLHAEAHETQLKGTTGAKAILAIVASGAKDLADKVNAARKPLASAPEAPVAMPNGVYFGFRADPDVQPKVAVLFPGQGSQYTNMGRDWALRYSEVRHAFEDADKMFVDAGLEQLSKVVYPFPTFTKDTAEADEQRLTETKWAQPALGTLSMGLYDVLHGKLGLQADCFGGHSYGELTALWAAGVLSREEFLRLSRTRGALMAEAASASVRSGMSALAGPVDKLKELLPTWSKDVVLANINTPDQAVVAGPLDALDAIKAPAEAAGFRVRPLTVSAAFHSPFVAAARDPFAKAVSSAAFSDARKPVYSNTTAKPYPANGLGRDMLADQLVKPVNFLGLVNEMYEAGARVFLEVGSKGVLTGLVSRILGDRAHTAISVDQSGGKENGDTALQKAVGNLLARGVMLDLGYLVDREPLPALKPTKFSSTTIMLHGANQKPKVPERPKLPPRGTGGPSNTVSASVVIPPPPRPVMVAPPPPPPPPPPAARPAAPSVVASPAPAQPAAPTTAMVVQPQRTAPPTMRPTIPSVPTVPAPASSNAMVQTTHAALSAFTQQQNVTAQLHQEFLRTSQEAMRTITQLFEMHARQMSGMPAQAMPGATVTELPPITVYPQTIPAPVTIPPPVVAAPPPRPAPVVAPPPPPVVRAAPPPAPPAPRPAPVAAVTPAALSDELAKGLLAIVSDKTGYPVDMLKVDMDLEADLGIDSIKRVEILGAMQAKFPAAAKVETEKLGEMHTLQQILDYLGQNSGAAVATAPAVMTATAVVVSSDMRDGLLAIVSDKTGYPVDMLKVDMDLEADLGIDSIKRVEILGAMQAKFPNAAKVETEKLGELHTLQQILDYLAQSSGGGAVVAAPVAVATTRAAPAGVPSDMRDGLLAIVSEKTGYPVDMLKVDMDLEADLGIDSIKRVEILGAMQAKFPNAAKVETEKLGELHTLQQILDYLAQSGGDAGVTAPVRVATSVVPSGMREGLLAIVGEKTGYPVDMLKVDMDLEADLGIDSIKRVEILGAMQAKFPNAAKVETEKLGELHTLQQILDYLGQNSGGAPAPAVVVAAPVRTVVAAAPAVSSGMREGLLAIVSEKTGYPVDMLKTDMDLEADLGIDSIKRVEILGAMQAKFPNAPKVETEKLGEMHTLQQILEYLGASASAPVSAPVVTQVAAPTPKVSAAKGSGLAASDLSKGLLEIVSEKTGYPVDMLKVDMDLEADLGIDSIKRVEILGAMQAKFPNAPKVETEKLGEMHTLAQIIGYLSAGGDVQPSGNGHAEKPHKEPNGEATTEGTQLPFEAAQKAPPIRRYKVSAAPLAPAPTTSSFKLPADHAILLTDDGQGFSTALATELTRAGFSVVIGHLPTRLAPFTQDAKVRAIDWTDEAKLAQGLASLGTGVGAVIHLAALRQTPAVRNLIPSDLKAALAEQVRGAFILARSTSAALQKAGGLFATVTAMDGGFGFVTGMSRPFAPQGALAGLVKTLAIEWPKVTCRTFDLEPSMSPGAAAKELAREIARGDGPVETGLATGTMRGLVMTHAAPRSTTPLSLDEKSVVLITGGARGVTADVALGMAQKWRPTLVLLGRSPAPTGRYEWCKHVPEGAELKKALLEKLRGDGMMVKPAELEKVYREVLAEREITESLDGLRAAGSTVEYRSVDVRDATAVGEVVKEARKLGTLAGLVHGAGVIQDKLVEQKTLEQFDNVFETKVLGLRAMLEALRNDDLKFVAMFSSIAGRAGNKGQSDYAMANECLNKMAVELKAQRPACHVVSIGWGPWQGGMVTPELEREFLKQGISAIPKDEGVQFFLDEVAAGRNADTEVVVAGLPVPRTIEFDVVPESDKYLFDHVLSGKPVVPAMMVLEWIAEAAQSTFPGMHLMSVEDLKVLKGIVCETARTRVRIVIEELAGSAARTRTLAVQVLTVEGTQTRLAYRAIARVTSEQVAAPAFVKPGDLTSARYGMTVTEAYRERLFHGPRFQVIETVEGTSELGMVARLRTSNPTGWSTHKPMGWATDPATLDGALQMLVLWLREKLGGSSLPSSVASYVQYAPLSTGAPVTVYMRMKEVNPHAGVADMVFVDGAGRVVAEMKSAELTVSASLNPMFRQAAGMVGEEVMV